MYTPGNLFFDYCFINPQGQFLPFYQYAKTFNQDTFNYDALKNTDYVFMRWKVSYVHIVHVQ